MDIEKLVMTVVTAVVTAVPILWKLWHNRKKEKEAADKLAQDVKTAADKLAVDHAEQLRIDSKKLAEQLEIAADKLAKEHARQLAEKEKKDKDEKQRNSEKTSVEFLIIKNREITHKTKRIIINFNAMRCYVIDFSNGTVTETGMHLLRVTFLHESVMDWTEKRVDGVSKSFKEAHMPDMFLAPMYHIVKAGEYYLKDVNTLDQKNVNSRDYHDWLKAYGVGSSLWLAIKNNEGKIVAVLVIHWPQPTDLAGHIIAKIKDVNRMIEQVYDEFTPYQNPNL